MAAKPEHPVPRRRRRTSFEQECCRRYPLNLWTNLICGLPLAFVLGIAPIALFMACLYGLAWLERVSMARPRHQPLSFNQTVGLVGLCFLLGYIVPYVVGFWLTYPWVRMRSRRALRRRGAPICIRCAYDMTGIDRPTCPECGRDHGTMPGTP